MSWSWQRPPSPSKEGETWDQEDPSSPGPGAGCEQAQPAAGVGGGARRGNRGGTPRHPVGTRAPHPAQRAGPRRGPRGSRPPGPQVPWAVSRGASRPGAVQGGRGSGEGLRRPSLPAPRLKPTAQTRPRVASCMKTPCSLWGVQTTQLSRKQRSPQTPPRRGSPPKARHPTPAAYGGPVQWTLQESSTIHAARTCLFHSTPQEQVDTQPLREHLSQLQEPGGAPRPLCSWPGLRAQDRWPWAEPTGASRGVARGLLTLRRDLVW